MLIIKMKPEKCPKKTSSSFDLRKNRNKKVECLRRNEKSISKVVSILIFTNFFIEKVKELCMADSLTNANVSSTILLSSK